MSLHVLVDGHPSSGPTLLGTTGVFCFRHRRWRHGHPAAAERPVGPFRPEKG
jgi:hypothetical protein